MAVSFDLADRIRQLPPYLFVEIDRLKNELIAQGKDVIDLGIGDPDIPTPQVIVDALKKAADKPQHHRYPSTVGMLSFRNTASTWMKKRFGVAVDPATEIVSLIGSKEGIAHMPLAVVNPGDYVLVPSPGYPPYTSGTLFAGGIPYTMPLLEQNDFLPDLDAIPADVASKAKIMFINYPNNPTAAVATHEFFKEVVAFADKYNIIVCHDAAYSEVSYDGYKAPSFLEVPGAKEVGVEFHSLSKTFCMTGWRIGFAAGNPQVVAALNKVKSNIDSGAFQAVQEAGIVALTEGLKPAANIYNVFERRRTSFVKGIQALGLECDMPKAAFYVWIKNPSGYSSASFSKKLLEEASLVLTPGNGFGKYGEGYVRAALTVSEERLQDALNRIKEILP